MLDLLTNTL